MYLKEQVKYIYVKHIGNVLYNDVGMNFNIFAFAICDWNTSGADC